MISYSLPEKYLITAASESKGVQSKFYKDGYWYKIDKIGSEGKVEFLSSMILEYSTLPDNSYVKYEWCKINGRLGCKSRSFVSDNIMFLSFKKIVNMIYGRDISNDISSLCSISDRLNYLLDIGKYLKLDLYNYIKTTLLLDMLILNRDRHFGNMGVLYDINKGIYRCAPIFDNGQSLNTGLGLEDNSNSCTISGSFESQVVAFGYPIESTFYIDYPKLFRKLNNYSGQEVDLLKSNLELYKRVFFRESEY